MRVLFKAHGLGNDYLVSHVPGPAWTADEVRAVCHRHTGCGGDGVLEPIADPSGYAVRIWNPDGSIAEKSGNGLRIFAWWLRRLKGGPPTFAVRVHPARGAPAVVRCEVDGDTVDVEMGAGALVGHRSYPTLGGDAVAVSVGNPHCVQFRSEAALDALPWRQWGAALENHPDFPERTNVQFARVTGPRALELRIWERGAGETSASGSSACAVAWASVFTGRTTAGPHTLTMPGGVLEVDVRPEGTLRLRGPVAPVGFFHPVR